MDDLSKIEKALLDYWMRHPHATDSADGISRWWLQVAAPDEVTRVLDWLVERGMVENVRQSNGECIYRRVHPQTK